MSVFTATPENAKCILENVETLNNELNGRESHRRATIAMAEREFDNLISEEKRARGLAADYYADQAEIEILARRRLRQRINEIVGNLMYEDRLQEIANGRQLNGNHFPQTA